MKGKKTHQEKLFINFQLSDYVPADNFYRRLKEQLDLRFIYPLTAEYYGTEGQKSIDPVVFMKLMLVGYLENLNSDRRIIATSRLHMDILYFIGYDLGEELPWHSTISRTRQLYQEHVFTELFKRVLKQCIDKGMVSGRRQAVDGFFIKANASLDSMVEKEILEDVAAYRQELQDNEEPATHTITHVQAFSADKRDSECLAAVLSRVKHTLLENDIALQEIVADTGYSSADALKALQASGVTGYIPNRGQFNFERDDGFTFDIEGDYYQCRTGKKLTYRTTHLTAGYLMKYYSVSRKECPGCPWSQECAAYQKRTTVIRETIDKPYYDIMPIRMQTRKAKILMKLRQSTVEPVIGTLVNYLGIKRVNAKGLNQANKCITMAAVAYNLKKC